MKSFRWASFKHAFRGFWVLLEQPNAKIHTIFTLLVIILGLWLDIRTTEWVAVLFCIALVIATEAINTALELLCDHVSPEYHKSIKKIKDVSAFGVLVSACIAVVVGVIVFGPYLKFI